MNGTPDVTVIGAGHNGLTAACLLARAGRSVVVLERSEFVGGLAAGPDFHPGYRSPGVFHDTTGVRASVVDSLDLARHGLRLRDRKPDVLALASDGRTLLLAGERERSAREIEKHSARDAERYLRFHDFLDGVRGVLRTFLDRPPVDLLSIETRSGWEAIRRAWELRRLGKRAMTELLRVPPMGVADWLCEWFETELLKAAMALPAVAYTFTGPRSPGSAMNLLLREGAAGPGIHGGGPALIAALESCARDAGVAIRTGAEVTGIECGANGVRSVSIGTGERIECRAVAASCDPKQLFLRLVPAGATTDRLERRIRSLRCRGTTAQVLLALNSPVGVSQGPRKDPEFVTIVDSLNQLERAHDAVKYRRCSEDPALELYLPEADAGFAPEGHAVASVLVHFAPRDVDGGWDDARRERFADEVLVRLERHVPGIAGHVIARRVLCPAMLESVYGVSGGHPHHVEHALDQLLVRPVPECVDNRTPIPGLFLCGSGSHPGGGLTCVPGSLAAAALSRS